MPCSPQCWVFCITFWGENYSHSVTKPSSAFLNEDNQPTADLATWVKLSHSWACFNRLSSVGPPGPGPGSQG